ncbi:MAG: cell division protein FtsA [Candidatus Nealsonbacteria bacterium]|nr:cell division protein FtsA [Candidatus Nealsonbacteria bacterium]
MAKTDFITGLDIGSNTIKILTAKKSPDLVDIEILFQGEEPSLGIRKGVVIDPIKVSETIQSLVKNAKTETGQDIDSVYVNINGSHIFSTSSHGAIAISRADQKVSEEDIERVLQAAQTFSLPANKEILDVFPREFIVDGEKGIKEVLGIEGVRLEAEVLVLAGFSPYKKNLVQAVLGSGLKISDIIISPLASSFAVLSQKQKELGVALLDIGAGTSSLAVFEEGDLIHLAIFPIGSSNITNDIAIGLKTDIDVAERIKIEYGSCFPGKEKKEKIETKDEESLVFSQKMLCKIIEARVSEIFEETQKELKKISKQELLPTGLVLTGAGAKLPKIIDLAKKELKLPCRLGKPSGFVGLEKEMAFSVACGLVLKGLEVKETEHWQGNGYLLRIIKKLGNRIKKAFSILIP